MKNKYLALLLTFFLGGLGIHKFYLEEKIAGILYLLFSWTFIPYVLAVLDFIGILTMSESSFDQKYNFKFVQGNSNYLQANTAPKININKSTNNTSTKDHITALKDLKQLHDEGIITPQEYEEKRRKFLDLL